MFKLKRLSDLPILRPNLTNEWEQGAVFNCAVVYEDGLFHMFYRASNRNFEALKHQHPQLTDKFYSVIGYARSKDGLCFERQANPVFVGKGEQEAWGVEDPRVIKVENTFYMIYTGFGGRSWDDHRICLASSHDLVNWKRHGVILDEVNKDGCLLDKKIDGKFVLFHRRLPHIWMAVSDDFGTWEHHRIIMETRPNSWESRKIGIAGVPIEIEQGYLFIYHAVDQDSVYRLGAALLDRNDPGKVLSRLQEPILEPELEWETKGNVPNVVFSCGHVVKDNFLYVYYGGADTSIGVAGISLDEIVF